MVLHLPAVLKAGGRHIEQNTMVLLQEITCRWCGKVFCVCQSCWRGQCYCGQACRNAAKRQAHRKAQKSYRQTEKGKKAHCEAEKRRRMGLTKKNKKTMDDTGTRPPSRAGSIAIATKMCATCQVVGDKLVSMRTGRCYFCGSVGVVVDRFPRRGYGRGSCQRTGHTGVRKKGKGSELWSK